MLRPLVPGNRNSGTDLGCTDAAGESSIDAEVGRSVLGSLRLASKRKPVAVIGPSPQLRGTEFICLRSRGRSTRPSQPQYMMKERRMLDKKTGMFESFLKIGVSLTLSVVVTNFWEQCPEVVDKSISRETLCKG